MWSKDYNKLDPELVEHTLEQFIHPNITPIDILKLGHIAGIIYTKSSNNDITCIIISNYIGKYGIYTWSSIRIFNISIM
jgi:hypothetical protein